MAKPVPSGPLRAVPDRQEPQLVGETGKNHSRWVVSGSYPDNFQICRRRVLLSGSLFSQALS